MHSKNNVTNEPLPPIIEVKTRGWFPPFNFIKSLIPGIIFAGLISVVLYTVLWFILISIAILLEDLDMLPATFEAFLFFFEDMIYGPVPYLLILFLGIAGTGFYAFYFQNIRITVDKKEVSFYRGKRKYRCFDLAENAFGSDIHTIRYYFLFKSTARYLTVDQMNGKRIRRFQCFGVSGEDFDRLLNHIWFSKAPEQERKTGFEEETVTSDEITYTNQLELEQEDLEFLYNPEFLDCNVPDSQMDEENLSPSASTLAQPLTHYFAIDKEAYLKGYKKEILSNFYALLIVPVTFIVMMLILGLPGHVIEMVFWNSLPALAVVSAILLGFLIYRSFGQKEVMTEIRRSTPEYITINEEKLVIGSDLGEFEYFHKHITELRVTPPSYFTPNNLRPIRRYVTITNYDGQKRRFLVGDADKSKWLYWASLQRPRENVFIDYEIFCETMLQLLGNENRFKLDLEQF